MDTDKYWTGLADVVSDYIPSNAKGAIYRVLTFSESYDEFVEKVRTILKKSGDILLVIEEPELLKDFLTHDFVSDDHEIWDLMEQAAKKPQDVVCGDLELYR
ncbi:MAG: hypothetical protein J5I65_10830 [Aridibacter famidurans]|nr:hypothetical protein [Aridibacter famidurans]